MLQPIWTPQNIKAYRLVTASETRTTVEPRKYTAWQIMINLEVPHLRLKTWRRWLWSFLWSGPLPWVQSLDRPWRQGELLKIGHPDVFRMFLLTAFLSKSEHVLIERHCLVLVIGVFAGNEHGWSLQNKKWSIGDHPGAWTKDGPIPYCGTIFHPRRLPFWEVFKNGWRHQSYSTQGYADFNDLMRHPVDELLTASVTALISHGT